MPVVTGRFAEARLYLRYCTTLLHPGRPLPTFAEPAPSTGNHDHLQEDDLTLLIEEGRRQLDRQAADLDRIRNRAGALATVSLALTSAAVAKSADILTRHWLIVAAWALSCVLAVLAVAGATAVLAGQAVFGRTDTRLAAQGPSPTRKYLAAGYIEQVSTGEETVRTFLTVFRDAVTLAVTSALIFLIVLASTLHSTRTDRTEPTCPTSMTCSQPTHPKSTVHSPPHRRPLPEPSTPPPSRQSTTTAPACCSAP
ncbi:hypothetical protein [Streptomyces griseorubiginosus]|uniref:hypothetical protein n=1 Tax=Streptomyces griseorubiginosus TaxID=67304 RepID=UPI00113FEC24|nr:hypothetical protein [Streptomyces griseorubiginosus]